MTLERVVHLQQTHGAQDRACSSSRMSGNMNDQPLGNSRVKITRVSSKAVSRSSHAVHERPNTHLECVHAKVIALILWLEQLVFFSLCRSILCIQRTTS